MTDPWNGTESTPGAYDPTPEQARRAALYVADRLGTSCGDILDALGLRATPEPCRSHYRDPSGRSIPVKASL